ncbi:MAG TPA: hypothetical protein VF942_17970 [Acidimicrobiales bacterium]
MLDSQMGALMRAAVERQGIGLMDAVDRLRLVIRQHYLQVAQVQWLA